MLGVALTAQRAGWGSTPLQALIQSTADVRYENYQTPAFSWLLDQDSTGVNGLVMTTLPTGEIDVTNYNTVAGFDNLKYTYVCTWKLFMPSGLSQNEGIKGDTRFFGQSGDFTGNMAWVHGYDDVPRLQINWPGVGSVELPGTSYQDYNNRWLTLVNSASDDPADFAGWSAGTSGPVFTRFAVYDSETGELVAKQDAEHGEWAIPYQGWPQTVSDWITNSGGTLSTDSNNPAYGWKFAWAIDTQPDATLRITNLWMSIGTMFDPESAVDRSWLTVRPSAQIDDAQAYYNLQMTNYEEIDDFDTVYVTTSGMDLYSEANDRQATIAQFGGNATIFNNRYSTTDIPKTGNF